MAKAKRAKPVNKELRILAKRIYVARLARGQVSVDATLCYVEAKEVLKTLDECGRVI
jgi:hypothetical protein